MSKTPDELMDDLNQVIADIREISSELQGLLALRRDYEDQLIERGTGRLFHINTDGSYGWDEDGWS